jgi:ABC-type transport system substrate-binding protein
MSYGQAGDIAAAQAEAIAQAIKASGAIIQVDPQDFQSILSRANKPLVVMAQGGFLKKNFQYLTAYKGLIFFTKSPTLLLLPGDVELITAKKIWIPS